MKIKYTILLSMCILAACSGRREEMVDDKLWVSIAEGDTIDCYIRYKGHIYSTDRSRPLEKREPLYPIDAATFMVCKGTGYAKDQYRVYYPLKPKYLRTAEDDLEKSVPYALQWVVETGNPEKFAYLGEGYGFDGDRMFLNGEPAAWNESIYRKYTPRLSPMPDSSDVVKRGFNGDVGIWQELKENEQRGNFVRIDGDIYVLNVKSECNMTATEFNYVEFLNCESNKSIKNLTKLEGVDLKSFKVCKGTSYAKDCNHIYIPDNWVKLKSPEFPDLSICSAKKTIVEEADVSTFRYIGDGLAVDRYNMYFYGSKVDMDTLIVNTAMRLHTTNLLFKWNFKQNP